MIAAALLAPVVVAQPAGAGPGTDGTAGQLAAAANSATTIVDHSTEMPRAASNEVTGDFLGLGYDQRAIIEGPYEATKLNIYDRDGTLLRSHDSPLPNLAAISDWYQPLWGNWADEVSKFNVLGRPQMVWVDLGSARGFVLVGLHSDQRSGHDMFWVDPETGCPELACNFVQEVWTQLPHTGPGPSNNNIPINTTALAFGWIGSKPVLAVGLSSHPDQYKAAAIQVYEIGYKTANNLNFNRGNEKMALSNDTSTPVTGLDWDDNGSGLLAYTVMTDERAMYAIKVPADGTLSLANRTYWDVKSDANNWQAMSVAIGNRADGSPLVAGGFNDGAVRMWDPAVQSANYIGWSTTDRTLRIEALTFIDRFDGTTGLPDLVAAGLQKNSAWVLRYNAGATTLKELPVAPNNGTTTDIGGIRAWFPGYKTGSVQFVNQSTSDEFELTFAKRPNAAYGCWYKGFEFEDRAELPADGVDLAAGQSSDVYALAAYTAGTDGGCAADDVTGQWAAYVTVTPKGRPSDRTIAKLLVSRSGQLTVESVGASPKLVATENTNPADPHPLGAWTIAIQSPDQPTPPTSLKITGTQLTASETDRPVYRIDVPATAWALPVSTPPRAETALPPMEAFGVKSDGSGDVSLGLLVPQGQPTRNTSGTVTLSRVSFYWQNPDTGQQITDIYVKAGSTSSAKVNLAGLPAPAAGTTISSVSVCPASGSSDACDGTATPAANGLDQSPLTINLYKSPKVLLPLTDKAYGRVYYTDEQGELVTGLIPANGSAYVRVSPFAGAYPNDGSSSSTGSTGRNPTTPSVGGPLGYLSTTSIAQQTLNAHVGGSPLSSLDIAFKAKTFGPEVRPGSMLDGGLYLDGCTDYSGNAGCKLVEIDPATNLTPSTPGLFLTADPATHELRIGLQLTNTAQTTVTGLPLEQVAGQPEHTLAAQLLNVNGAEVTISSTSGFHPADKADTWLVTHGMQVLVSAVQVMKG